MMNKKRLKSKNFTLAEEEYLMMLVEKYWSVLGNKITDSDANK